jgi:tetratricopeptide (TPR) repeat protein
VSGAVFVSYASQDAEAAQRLCGALRSVGVEVWFDQSELVGGDAWDAKIRAQIRACALFMPVISAATQARREGYFRIEWKLAAQRSHAFADGTPFLLPVVIDATRDTEALVPEEFRAVQWTRLPAGDAGPAFCARVKRLLATEADVGVPNNAPGRSPGSHEASSIASRRWLALAALGLVVLAGAIIWRPWRGKVPQPVSDGAPGTASQNASQELAQIRAHLVPQRFLIEDFNAVSLALDRLIAANPENSDAWALRSMTNSLSVIRTFDSGTKPLEVGKEAAERAAQLAPDSPMADLAMGLHLVAMTSRGGDAEAAQPYIHRALARLPRDPLTRYTELIQYWEAFQFDDAERCARDWLKEEPNDAYPPWILAQISIVRRQPEEAEKWAERAALDHSIMGIRALVTRFEVEFYLRADLPGARAALDRIPSSAVPTDRVVYARWLLAMAEHRWDEALQGLAQIPETTLFDRSFQGPKAFLAGLAHQTAGRPEAALAQFKEAERVLHDELALDPDNAELHAVLAVTLASSGRNADASVELATIEPLLRSRKLSLFTASDVVLIAQAYAAAGDARQTAVWLRRLLSEPSVIPMTPATLRIDSRFAAVVSQAPIPALLSEFARLDMGRPSTH